MKREAGGEKEPPARGGRLEICMVEPQIFQSLSENVGAKESVRGGTMSGWGVMGHASGGFSSSPVKRERSRLIIGRVSSGGVSKRATTQ